MSTITRDDIGQGIAPICEILTKCDLFVKEKAIRSFLAACAVRIWSANVRGSDDYIEAIDELLGERPNLAQIVTALDCAFDHVIEVPSFFQQVVLNDIRSHTQHCRDLIAAIENELYMLAMINGDFTVEEAVREQEIIDMLTAYCNQMHIPMGAKLTNRSTTQLNQFGYHIGDETIVEARSDEKPSVKKENPKSENTKTSDHPKKAPRKNPKEKKKDDDDDDGLTLHLTFTLDPETGNLSPCDDDDEKDDAKPVVSKTSTDGDDTIESVMAELNGMVGLDNIKRDVQSLMNFIRIQKLRKERGMKTPTLSYHLVFTGNPGTGKTTVARLIAKLYYLMGILPQGQLVEADRSSLVAGYLGQTAIKTKKVIDSALGGVLFIDEAYSLAGDDKDSYGMEAIETILKNMEDHRDELVVIVAGYDELMHKFIDSNPGLHSRFSKYFHFNDYNGSELLLIFKRFCESNGYELSEEASEYLSAELDEMYEHRVEHFGNARDVRNLFERAINVQANRLASDPDLTDEELITLTTDDVLTMLEGK